MAAHAQQNWLRDKPDVFARLAALHPKKIDLSLERIERLLEKLDHPEKKLPPVVHVAGTNGKGSVVAFLAAFLKEAGATTHIYTSPHLVRFNERIIIAGAAITDQHMVEKIMQVENANQSAPLTFFEAMTAAALLAFSETPADFCLLETGLGGRLDATNIIAEPVATLITPISYDHQAFLGETLPKIAGEKAGIIKPNRPIVLAAQTAAALAVMKECAAKNRSPLFYEGEAWHITKTGSGWHYKDDQLDCDLPMPSLRGAHQLTNAACALFAFNHFCGRLNPTGIARALEETHWPARLQKLSIAGRQVFLDGGHNAAAAQMLADFLVKEKGARPAFLICALRATKSVADFIAPFANIIDGLYALDLPLHQHVPGEGAGAYSSEAIVNQARAFNIPAQSVAHVEEAIQKISAPQPLILIAGSLLLAGDVLKQFEN